MNYITVTEAAEKWNLTTRRVRMLCAEDKIEGVIREGASVYDTGRSSKAT